MNMQALVLADRTAGDFEPLARDLSPALLSVAGKPVIQHCIEDCWEAGIREVLVAVPAGDRTIREELGDGQRFGLAIRYLESGGQQWPGEVLALAGLATEAPLLVARGDVLRGRCASRLLEQAVGVDGDVVLGLIGARPAGIALLRRRCKGINQLDWSLAGNRAHRPPGPCVELGDVGLALLDGPAELFHACLDALDGRYADLVPEGRTQPGAALWLGPRATIARSVHVAGTARVGRGAELHEQVELAGRVEIGDRSVIDAGAQLVDAVVLPGTYVGRGVRLQNAIACGAWLYRVDLGTCQRIEDPLLLAGPLVAAA
jgi:NDP-sugar pyrophosphorylase family protein